MKLTPKQFEGLLGQTAKTREHELNCNECLDLVAEFIELELAGKTIPSGLDAVRHHLDLCPECREEFDTLRDVLVQMDGGEAGE